MKRALFTSLILTAGLAIVFVACNFHKTTIYKVWTFSNIHPIDTAKATPMDNFTYSFLDKTLQNVRFQFSADKTIKMSDSSGKVLSTGKFEMPDANSMKFSFGNDSVTLYKVDLTDTALNLTDEKQGTVMHLTSKQ